MIYPIVEELKAEGVRFATSCRVFGFSPQGFYKWRNEPSSARDRSDAELVNVMYDIHADDPEFGCRFIADELHRLGHAVSGNRVHRLCQQQKIFSTTIKKGRHAKKPGPPAHHDLVGRDLTAERINQRWVGNITERWTGGGKLYLRTFRDLWSNWIVGYSISDRMTANLAVVALRNAGLRRGCDGVIVHTDRGSQAGFNWSSQHPVPEVLSGSSTAGSRSSDSTEVEVAWSSEVSASCSGGVLDPDRRGSPSRGSICGGRRGSGCGCSLVPQRWRYAAVRYQATGLRPIPLLR